MRRIFQSCLRFAYPVPNPRCQQARRRHLTSNRGLPRTIFLQLDSTSFLSDSGRPSPDEQKPNPSACSNKTRYPNRQKNSSRTAPILQQLNRCNRVNSVVLCTYVRYAEASRGKPNAPNSPLCLSQRLNFRTINTPL